ncbi:MAG: NAD(P)(+) transhydrogenase (Re/Si-specific) subunit beta [Myxococcales bacterium]|nr:NAD(P)(+) transhydrogenase (Re/Si-specific) subunit beta [Myxococcales bacterium]
MSDLISSTLVPLIYLLSAVLFILGLKRLGRVRTARSGNTIASTAMLLAVLGTLLDMGQVDYRFIIAGVILGGLVGGIAAVKVEMTSMPEMVALFNGFGGAASALVALAVVWQELVETGSVDSAASVIGGSQAVTVGLSILIGALTLSGSLIAFLKLQGKLKRGQPIMLPGRHVINALLGIGAVVLVGQFAYQTGGGAEQPALMLTLVSLALGVLLVIPIGGADMPVVVSLLNSYSGMAASATGFVLGNNLLIISGALVGASGLILTQIMCVAMNRSLLNVLVGGFGEDGGGGGGDEEYSNVTSCGAEEAAMLLETAESVVVVPGYGLAVAQAQHAVREMADLLIARGCKVTYAIHPVAGRMPGHMNVLLAEADVPYEQLLEMDVINPEFKSTDVSIVLGANDVVNPAALSDKSSPIYGMPILNVHDSRSVFVVKRSLSPGYAGIKNTLFEHDNTTMIFGDAKKVLQDVINELKSL